MDIRAKVFELMDNALNNGYNPLADTVEVNIQDLYTFADYDFDFEVTKPEQIKPFVIEWRAKHAH